MPELNEQEKEHKLNFFLHWLATCLAWQMLRDYLSILLGMPGYIIKAQCWGPNLILAPPTLAVLLCFVSWSPWSVPSQTLCPHWNTPWMNAGWHLSSRTSLSETLLSVSILVHFLLLKAQYHRLNKSFWLRVLVQNGEATSPNGCPVGRACGWHRASHQERQEATWRPKQCVLWQIHTWDKLLTIFLMIPLTSWKKWLIHEHRTLITW